MPVFNLTVSTNDTLTAANFYEKHAEIYDSVGLTSIDRNRWKIFSAASSISQLYAAFEREFTATIKDYIAFVESNHPALDFPNASPEAYRKGISTLLAKKKSDRYEGLSESVVIQTYLNYLENSGKKRIHPEAILVRDQNLRFDTIIEILARIGIRDFESWIAHSDEFKGIYESGSPILEVLKSDWKDFVQWRNDASHGVLEELPGEGIVTDFGVLVRAMCKALADYLTNCLIESDSNEKVFACIGQLTEYFATPKAAIISLKDGVKLSIDDELFLLGAHSCSSVTLQSIRVNDVDVDTVTSNKDKYEIGAKLSLEKPRVNSKVYVLKSAN